MREMDTPSTYTKIRINEERFARMNYVLLRSWEGEVEIKMIKQLKHPNCIADQKKLFDILLFNILLFNILLFNILLFNLMSISISIHRYKFSQSEF